MNISLEIEFEINFSVEEVENHYSSLGEEDEDFLPAETRIFSVTKSYESVDGFIKIFWTEAFLLSEDGSLRMTEADSNFNHFEGSNCPSEFYIDNDAFSAPSIYEAQEEIEDFLS